MLSSRRSTALTLLEDSETVIRKTVKSGSPYDADKLDTMPTKPRYSQWEITKLAASRQFGKSDDHLVRMHR